VFEQNARLAFGRLWSGFLGGLNRFYHHVVFNQNKIGSVYKRLTSVVFVLQ
jgi:hypothetical protein